MTENDEWREPWDEKYLTHFRNAKVKCDICGRTIPISEARIIASGSYTHPILKIQVTNEVAYCPRCYRERMDGLVKNVEILPSDSQEKQGV